MKQTPSREKWLEAVSARYHELFSEVDRVNLEIYLAEDAIAYVERRIQARGTEFCINDGPDDSDLESVLANRKAELETLQRLRRAISADIPLVGGHLKALRENWPEMDEEVLEAMKDVFGDEQVNEE